MNSLENLEDIPESFDSNCDDHYMRLYIAIGRNGRRRFVLTTNGCGCCSNYIEGDKITADDIDQLERNIEAEHERQTRAIAEWRKRFALNKLLR